MVVPAQGRVVGSVSSAGIGLRTAGAGTGHTSAALFHPTAMYAAQPPGPGVYRSTRATRRSRSGVARTVVMSLVLAVGGVVVGTGLTSAAAAPVPGGPVDLGPERTLGPLPSAPPSAPAVEGAAAAAEGRIDGGVLRRLAGHDVAAEPAGRHRRSTSRRWTRPSPAAASCSARSRSRTGEKRNLTANCRNWQSVWAQKVNQIKPAMAVIMIGAWDVFDLTLDSGQTLPFGSPGWDANFTAAVRTGVDTLRAGKAEVALALLPCYRPIKASAGFWPERGDDVRTRHVNDLLRAVAAGYPSGVRTLDPPAQFCTDPAIGSDTSYRWDGVHYYKKGAALYFTTVLPQLTADRLDVDAAGVAAGQDGAGWAAASTALSTVERAAAEDQSPNR